MSNIPDEKERLNKANEFITIIASCGRNFFKHEDRIAYLEISDTGRVFFIDDYTKKRIYTHLSGRRWRGFSHGGTLKRFIESLRNYVKRDEKMNLRYFESKWAEGYMHPWEYGVDLKVVKEAASRLGIAV